MLKRLIVYIIVATGLFIWISQHKFMAPLVFDDWRMVELVWAAKNGDTKKMDYLIEQGADVNYKGNYSFTPLSWVLLKVSSSEQAKKGYTHLLINKANTSDPLAFGLKTPLHYAASIPDSDYLSLMLKHGHDVKINDDRFGETPLVKSIYASQFNNFKNLLDSGANVNFSNSNLRSPLEISKGSGSWKFVLELLKRGSDYNQGVDNTSARNPEGLSSLVWTLENIHYWPKAAESAHGIDYREKVIDFLKNEGVEVYPWYPEDDPRHNPRPKETPEALNVPEKDDETKTKPTNLGPTDFAFPTENEIPPEKQDPDYFYTNKDFLIIASTKSFEEAQNLSIEAASKLNLELRTENTKLQNGALVNTSEANCKKLFFEGPCYLARGRYDDGIYVSIESSSAYENFAKGYYIVVIASDFRDENNLDEFLNEVRDFYPDAYLKTTKVFMGSYD